MEAYFDKENLDSYIHSAANPAFADCNRMLKEHFSINFNFDKDTLKTIPDIQSWIVTMTSGIGTSKTKFLGSPYPPRPLSISFLDSATKEQLSSVYLITDKEHSNRAFECVLISPPKKEVETLSKFMISQSAQFHKRKNPRKMQSWQEIDEFVLPCTDVIIVDRYLFSGQDLNEYNLFPLLKTLNKYSTISTINIVIFVLKNESTPNSEYLTIKQRIEEQLTKVISQEYNITKKPNVCIVVANNKETFGEHARTIFTNFRMMDSDDTFNFFGSSGCLTQGRYLDIFSLAYSEYWDNALDFLNDISQKIKDILDTQHEIIGRKGDVYGNFKSNYLKF